MSSATDTGEAAILVWLATQYDEIGLSTTDPGDDGANITEPVGNSYARVASPSFGAPSGTSPTQMANDVAVTFAASSGSWGTITHWVGYVSDVAHIHGALTAAKPVTDGDVAEFAIGTLVVTCD